MIGKTITMMTSFIAIALALTLVASVSAVPSSEFTRGSLVFDEDFEIFEDWADIGGGTVTQFNDPDNAVSGIYVGQKMDNNDPQGAIKQLDKSVDDFEIILYSKKGEIAGGNALRYSVVQETTGSGYGFYLTNASLVIEKRDTNHSATSLKTVSESWDLDEWNTFRFIKEDSNLTLEFYKNQIVPSDDITNGILTRSITTTDYTYSGGFNYATINGGQDYDTDDYMVWELLNIPKQTLGDLDCSIDQIAKYDGTGWICADLDDLEFTTYTMMGNIVSVQPGSGTQSIALCNDGDTIVSGGYERVNGEPDSVFALTQKPTGDLDGWIVQFGSSSQSGEMRAIAYCTSGDPNLIPNPKFDLGSQFKTYLVKGSQITIEPDARGSEDSIALCDSGDKVLASGGFFTSDRSRVYLSDSDREIVGDQEGWSMNFHIIGGGNSELGEARALCLDLEPLRP